METKVKKATVQRVIIDKTLNKFKNKDLFPEKTNKFNEMVSRIGEDKFTVLTGAKKKKLNHEGIIE
ncbi:MAG: hypothetical protein IPO92_11195 [Saprospiraceae bacterium]|nr:hypothetical protein [Saprospiraceae bacterium]